LSTSFSWLSEVQRAQHNPAGLKRLQQALCRHPIQGFEMEVVGRCIAQQSPEDHLPRLRVAILSGYASQPLANAVRVAALREDWWPVIYEAPYGSIKQEIYSRDSGLYRFKPDLILLDIGYEDLVHIQAAPIEEVAVIQALDLEMNEMQSLWSTLRKRVEVPVLQHTIVEPDEMLSGVAEQRVPWSASAIVEALNHKLIRATPDYVHWVDVSRLARLVGILNWRDPRLAHHAKYRFAIKHLPEYADLLGGCLRALYSRAPKALIVDLDNTLWGGVVGDEGLDGIRLGPETPEGSAYERFCKYLVSLRDRGVVLGICSKNDESIALEVFEKHPHMPLRIADFAATRCNWSDKASNLLAISKDLNIDSSALVYIDDNPAECELIRQCLPQVRVVQMDGDPASFCRRLDARNLFHQQEFSDDDFRRSRSYQARRRAAELQSTAPDLESYLASLQMVGRFDAVTSDEQIKRLAQLEAKTNQFNLNTRRLTHAQLSSMVESKDCLVFAVSLVDRFADHGLIAYIAAAILEDRLNITDWVMSCRVFSRGLEYFTIQRLATVTAQVNKELLSLHYTPTQKNKFMPSVFKRIGFHCDDAHLTGPWCLRPVSKDLPPHYIKVQ